MPAARTIVGDDTLATDRTLEALKRQANEDPVCQVIAARAGVSGYHIAVSGAAARFV